MTVRVVTQQTEWQDAPSSPARFANLLGEAVQYVRGPQATMVSHPPGSVSPPHFHIVDQFQIFIRGSGTIGKAPIEPVTLHYTDSFTPYGPIEPGADGIGWINLRPCHDPGQKVMPGAKDKMIRRAGRHRTIHWPVAESPRGPLSRATLIEEEDDGLCAFTTTAGPGVEFAQDAARGSGLFELVLGGSLEIEGKELGEYSLIYATPGDRLPPRRSGQDGVQVLTAQSPTP